MDAWRLDEDAGLGAGKTMVKATRRVFFADGDDGDSPVSTVDKSVTRKKTARRELVIDDDDIDKQTGGDKRIEYPPIKQSGDKKKARSAGGKVNETAEADVVQSVGLTGSGSSVVPSAENIDQIDPNAELEAFVHHLVRSHLIVNGHDDVAAMLESEKPCPALDEAQLRVLFRQLTASTPSSSGGQSLLGQFLCSEKNRADTASKSSSQRGSKESTKSKSSSSSRRKKPALNVITTTPSEDQVDDEAAELGYNKLNHPGSTPRPSADAASILGDPGSTPMARAKDLAALGFDDIDAEPLEVQQQPAVCEEDTESMLSQYALAKRAANKHKKRVRLGDAGTTPTKEYVFFRETPPRFVTETVEAAVEVFTALGNDPDFQAQAAVVEKFIELQSSDVGKYRVGQRVESLGAQRNVTGVVAKVFGSRECGTSGPGTIVIDTSPDDAGAPSEQ